VLAPRSRWLHRTRLGAGWTANALPSLARASIAAKSITLAPAAQSRQQASVTILPQQTGGLCFGAGRTELSPAVTLVTAQSRFGGDRSPLRFQPMPISRGSRRPGVSTLIHRGLLVLTQDGRIANTADRREFRESKKNTWCACRASFPRTPSRC